MNYELFSFIHYLIHHFNICFRPVEYGEQVAVHPFGIDVFGQGEVTARAGAEVAVQGNFKVGVICWVIR